MLVDGAGEESSIITGDVNKDVGGAHVSYSRLSSPDNNSQASKAGKLVNVTCKFKEEVPVAKVELNSTKGLVYWYWTGRAASALLQVGWAIWLTGKQKTNDSQQLYLV